MVRAEYKQAKRLVMLSEEALKGTDDEDDDDDGPPQRQSERETQSAQMV